MFGAAEPESTHHDYQPQSSNKNSAFAMQWLRDNFEFCANAHIAREIIYKDYQDHCDEYHMPCLNSASFGKIIRHVFPTIATRRLGTRGNSKYHYYGIKSKKDEAPSMSTKPPPKRSRTSSNLSLTNGEQMSFARPAPTDEFVHDLLRLPMPDFTKLPVDLDSQKTMQFLELCRPHCEQILKLGLKGEFDKFSKTVILFWQQTPDYLTPILNHPFFARIAAEWDALIYQAMLTVFLPDILGPGDKLMLRDLKNFTKQLPVILSNAMGAKPGCVYIEKARVAADFEKIVKQYYHLNHLALSANHVMTCPDTVSKMTQVWETLDFDLIVSQAIYICPNIVESLRMVQENVTHKLAMKANVAQWAEWIFALTEELLHQEHANYEEYMYFCQQYLIRWSYVSSLVLRDICEKSKEIFASFHLIRLFADEYVKYLVDCKLDEKRRHLEAMQLEGAFAAHPSGFGMEMLPGPYDLHHDYAGLHHGAPHEPRPVLSHSSSVASLPHPFHMNVHFGQHFFHDGLHGHAQDALPPLSSALSTNTHVGEESSHSQPQLKVNAMPHDEHLSSP